MCELCNNKNRIFEEKARKVHGDKYDYSKVEYVNCDTKVCIICPVHGEFWQSPSAHLYGYGCRECGCSVTALKNTKYNKQNVYEIALKYKSRSEFEHNDPYAYNLARKKGWCEEYTWLKTPERYKPVADLKDNIVYAYFFNDNVYIGRTNNIKDRDSAHRHSFRKHNGGIGKSAVLKYADEHNCEIPQPVILEEHLTLQESRKKESDWCDYYKNKGYKLLNVGKVGENTGAIGGYMLYNDYDEILKIAKKYKKVSEFKKENHSMYNAIRRMKLLSQLHEDCGWKENAHKKGILVYNNNGELLFECCSAREAQKITKVDFKLISMCALGKIKQSHGYVFKFKIN